ncbi:MAG: glycosyltransferase [Sulfurovum sp.]|nr:glycosyltransferase [Sulfurovum sp.]
MKVLIVANAYPNEQQPYFGIYIKEQFEYIRDHYDMDVDLFVLNGKSSLHKYLNPMKLYRKIKDFDPDIIHVHYGLSGIPLLLISPFVKKKKIVVTYHGDDINAGGIVLFISKMLIKYADINIAVSQHIFEKVKSISKKTAWIPCGVDDMFFEKLENRERKNAIIFPASPARVEKNYPLFEKMLYLLNTKYGLDLEVIFFDHKSREEVKNALLEAKCLVMTSLSEGSPQVIKEAIACDTPIVSTAVGDVPYLIEKLDNCYIAQTAEELAQKVALVFGAEHRRYSSERKQSLGNAFLCGQIVELYKALTK